MDSTGNRDRTKPQSSLINRKYNEINTNNCYELFRVISTNCQPI